MPDQPYRSYRDYMTRHYGAPLYRVPIDLGLGCPNRSTDGRGGCSFCAEDGGRAQQTFTAESLDQQIKMGIDFARRRYGAEQFMLYVQAYTGTFDQPNRLAKQLQELLRQHPFRALSIGTRPDCLPKQTLNLLQELNHTIETWVELGIQTVHDYTLNRIRRGHDWAAAKDAMQRLRRANIKIAAHIILGLPGEGRKQFRQTANALAQCPIEAIKIHNLHLIKGTQLARDYEKYPFPLLDEYQYAEALIDVLRRLPAELPIMRLTTDTPPEQLLAPQWQMTKGQFADYLTRQMELRGVTQGDRCKNDKAPAVDHRRLQPLPTNDGSITFWSEPFNEHYHCQTGALTEAEKKFVGPAKLQQRLKQHPVRLLDICFGLGYNSLAACEKAEHLAEHPLSVTAMEIDAQVIAGAAVHLHSPDNARLDWNDCLRQLIETGNCHNSHSTISLLLGDARARLKEVGACEPFELIFLDAFSTQRNSELWTLDFLLRLKGLLTEEGVLLTYCAALPVRAALLEAGYHVGSTPPIGRKRGGTIASPSAAGIERPLPQKEIALIQSSNRGVPYRDPHQTWTNKQILRHREQQIKKAKDS